MFGYDLFTISYIFLKSFNACFNILKFLVPLLLNVDIIISMDTDVNLQEIRHMCHKFYRIRNVYYTYDKHHVLPDKSSIVDANDKVFQYFMKYKIKYDENEEKEYCKILKGNTNNDR